MTVAERFLPVRQHIPGLVRRERFELLHQIWACPEHIGAPGFTEVVQKRKGLIYLTPTALMRTSSLGAVSPQSGGRQSRNRPG